MTDETPFNAPRDQALDAFHRLTGLAVHTISYAGHERERTRAAMHGLEVTWR